MAAIALAPRGRGWTFVLRDGAITAGRVGADQAEIESLVRRLRAGVESGDAAKPFDAEAAHRLHRALFAEVEAPLAEARRLVVAPGGPLLSIPFGVLVEAPPPAPQGHEGVRFLLARLPVVHVPAPASLVALRRAGPSQAPRPWFGFGDPRPLSPAVAARSIPGAPECGRLLAALPALNTAGLELAASAQLMGAGPGEMRTGAAFTAEAVRRTRLRDYRLVHFATHGLLPGELSCLSEPAIVTSASASASAAPGRTGDPGALLMPAAVLELDLDADAVVLSACNSGGGAAAGESLSSLARAFFYAGARSLLVTHWYVNDAAAARVSAFTLRNLRQGGQDLAEALRAAQLDLARNVEGGAHPALWAPFALIGPGPGAAAATSDAAPAARQGGSTRRG
jgi:CHAT domain-containing protein